MTTRTLFRRLSAVALGLVSLVIAGCPWPRGDSPYSNCSFFPNQVWVAAGFQHILSQPTSCPVNVSAAGSMVDYAASVQAPAYNVAAYAANIYTDVYSSDRLHLIGVSNAWYQYTFTVYEADIAFNYLAGSAQSLASSFTDDAVTLSNSGYGTAEADVGITYRKGAVVALQGPASPTPGTTPTWTASIGNATSPYTYRWFKDGVELSGQTSSSLQLPVTNAYFTLKVIGQAASGGADTLAAQVAPSWHVAIYGMSDRSPSLANCPFDSDAGTNPNGPFTYRWTLDGFRLQGTAPTVDPTLSVGSHTLDLTVTDVNGYAAIAAMTITVREGGPSNCV